MSSFSGLQKKPQLNISLRKYYTIIEQVLMRFSSWFIDPWYLILTKASGWVRCKISRVEKSCCQPILKGHNWFIKCFAILLHTYRCNLNSYLWKREWKIKLCVNQTIHRHNIMMSQYPLHLFTSEAQFLAYIFYQAASHVVFDNQKREILFI